MEFEQVEVCGSVSKRDRRGRRVARAEEREGESERVKRKK